MRGGANQQGGRQRTSSALPGSPVTQPLVTQPEFLGFRAQTAGLRQEAAAFNQEIRWRGMIHAYPP